MLIRSSAANMRATALRLCSRVAWRTAATASRSNGGSLRSLPRWGGPGRGSSVPAASGTVQPPQATARYPSFSDLPRAGAMPPVPAGSKQLV